MDEADKPKPKYEAKFGYKDQITEIEKILLVGKDAKSVNSGKKLLASMGRKIKKCHIGSGAPSRRFHAVIVYAEDPEELSEMEGLISQFRDVPLVTLLSDGITVPDGFENALVFEIGE